MKRAHVRMLAVMLVVVMAFAIAGCGSNNSKDKINNSNSPAASGNNNTAVNSDTAVEKKKLTLWFYFEGKSQFDIIKSVTDGFTKVNPMIEVEPVYIPFADFKKRLSVGLAAADLPDIVIIDN
ncbi:MAG: ABC transporter substrate-binding protein, partial [Bacilli bacterium]